MRTFHKHAAGVCEAMAEAMTASEKRNSGQSEIDNSPTQFQSTWAATPFGDQKQTASRRDISTAKKAY
jgi:hypothetical protein